MFNLLFKKALLSAAGSDYHRNSSLILSQVIATQRKREHSSDKLTLSYFVSLSERD